MTQRDALDRVLADFRREIHTCFPAQVLAYNVTAQTVDVQPAVQRELPSDVADEPFGAESMPILYSVPVQWPRAGGGALTFPILVGDWVGIECAEQSLLVWRQSGGADVSPGLDDPHGLNGAIARPGWYPDSEALTLVSATDIELRAPTGGVVVLGQQSGAQFVALSNLVAAEFAKVWKAIEAHTHTSAAAGSPTTPPVAVAAPTVVAGWYSGATAVTTATSTAATKVKAR